jgi:maleate isomerase
MTRFKMLQPKQPLEHLAQGGRVGLISLATDFNIEDDLARLYPDDVSFFTSRVRNYNPLTTENLRRMAPGITQAADCLLPGTKLGAVIYACTSGTVAIGADEVTRLVNIACPGVPVTNPVTAATNAFAELGAKRISILTPYTEAVNRDMATYFEAQGLEVLNISGFGFEDDTAMSFISPADIEDAAMQTFDPRADLLFISCTALRTLGVIETLENRLRTKVVTSNQALAWHSLQLMKCSRSIFGFGQLMRDHLVHHKQAC